MAFLRVSRDAQRFGDESVLLNELFSQAESTSCIYADRLEVLMFESSLGLPLLGIAKRSQAAEVVLGDWAQAALQLL